MVNLKGQRLLVIAPHPDDEIIGCGGLIQKVKNAGGQVYVLFLTVGETKDFSKDGISSQSTRENEIEKVAKFLRYDDYHIAFPGNKHHLKLDTLGQAPLVDMIERGSTLSIERIKPTIIAFPDVFSYNQDHEAAAKATHAALRISSKEKHFVETVLSYESAADFWSLSQKSNINIFLPLTKEDFKKKITALKLYASQWREYPNSRSEEVLTVLAKLRGSYSNSKFGEGFNLYRGLLK